MGRKSRIKKEGKIKGMYKLIRQEKDALGSYDFPREDGTVKKMALNPLKHILLLKPYKDKDAKGLLNETYRQYKAFIEKHKNDANIATEAQSNIAESIQENS